jgi:CheY-like chemotaxis protein
VAQTGWGQHQDRRRTRDAGFDDHVTKPVDRAKLMQLLAEHGPRVQRAAVAG